MTVLEREAQIRDAAFRMSGDLDRHALSFSLDEVAFLLERIDMARKISAYQVQFGTEMKDLADRLQAALLRVRDTEFAPDIWGAHEDCISAAKKALDGPYTAHRLSPRSPEKASGPLSSSHTPDGQP